MTHDETGITVIGRGTADATPDMARVDLGVSVRSDTVAEATRTARERAAALTSALHTKGIPPNDISTTGFSVYPEYDHQDGRQRLLGYRVSNDLQVVLRDLSSAGEIIDAAVGAAEDVSTVNGFTLSVTDDTEARDAAREAAWDDATRRAEHLASLAGRSLGAVVSVVETSGASHPPRPMMRMAMAEATPIEPGTQAITVVVEVRFELD